MKMKLFTLFMAVSFVLAACGGNNNESKEKNTGGQATATDGEEIYQQNCTKFAMVRIWPAVPLRV